MKRKAVVFLVILAAAVLAVGIAMANEYVNPFRSEMQAFRREIEALRKSNEADGGLVSNGSVSGGDGFAMGPIKVTISGTKKPKKTLTFKVEMTDGSDPSNFDFTWGIYDYNWEDAGYLFYTNKAYSNITGRTSVKYKFWSAGNYELMLWIRPVDDPYNAYAYAYVDFTIADDGVSPTPQEKAQEIVNQCKGSDAWHTALNLYDWLTKNCYYDNTYEHYGLDSFFTGYGVCDSFSKCYKMLLTTAGIPADRAFGENHAWNVLQLGGKWYQADPTWDIGGSYKPGEGEINDGNEDHEFFCLSEKALKPVSSHHYEDGSQGGPHVTECTSMAANYFIKTGEWKEFGDYLSLDGESYGMVTVINQAKYWLEAGQTAFVLSAWETQGHISYASIRNEIIQAGLLGEELLYDGEKVKLRTEPVEDSWGELNAYLDGWNIKETGTLKLPKGLTVVTTQDYAGTGATTVIIQPGCTSIGAGAFRDSKVRTVVIPDSVTKIAEDAFDGCGRLVFRTKNETAIQYAQARNYLVVDP